MEQKTEDLSLTPRQFQALEAAFDGQNPRYVRNGTYGDGRPYYRAQTNMGGAVTRMVDDLRERGLLAQSRHDYFRDQGDDYRAAQAKIAQLPENLRLGGGALTVKGLRAFEAALAKKKFDPTDDRLNRVRAAIPVREKFEADLGAALKALDDADCEAYARKNKARHKARIADVMAALHSVGVNRIMDDAEVLAFANKVAEASHSNNYVRYLDAADLSAELDALEKESHRPGTIGADMRSKKVQAIRAELARRAEKAA